MQVFVNVMTKPEKFKSVSGRDVWTFKARENFGKGDSRTFVEYDVFAFVSAAGISENELLRVTGRLSPQLTTGKDGQASIQLALLTTEIESFKQTQPEQQAA